MFLGSGILPRNSQEVKSPGKMKNKSMLEMTHQVRKEWLQPALEGL